MNLQENIQRIKEVMMIIEDNNSKQIYVDMGGVLFPSGSNDEVQQGTTERPKDIKEFQSWVINNKKDNRILGQYGNDGKWGKKTSQAWLKYGEEYKNSFPNSTVQGSTNFIGKNLWNGLKQYNPMILTSTGGGPNKENKIRNKSKQVTNILGLPLSKVIFVDHGTDKAKYAKGNILIDDSLENISAWKNNGGIGILHRDANTTLKELSKYL